MIMQNFQWLQKQYQNKMPGEKTPSKNFGKMQAAFIASSTLKRNKRYLDIEKINVEEQTSHIKRRRPVATSKSIEAKINRSFSNSTAALTERLQKDISRFRSRFSSHDRPSTAHSFYMRQTDEPVSPKKARGVGIGQHLPRQQYYKVHSKPVIDERLFSNYNMVAPDEKHTTDLGRGPQRNFDNSLKHINHLQYNTVALYQQNNYRRTTMDCRFHYKKQKEEDRYFFRPKRPQNKPGTDLSPEAVERAMQTVRLNPKIDSFFMNSGRELPCQLQQRSGNVLTSHWRGKEGKIDRAKVEYSVRSLKERLCQERKEKISASKHPNFKRNEVCDRKYFIVQVEA